MQRQCFQCIKHYRISFSWPVSASHISHRYSKHIGWTCFLCESASVKMVSLSLQVAFHLAGVSLLTTGNTSCTMQEKCLQMCDADSKSCTGQSRKRAEAFGATENSLPHTLPEPLFSARPCLWGWGCGDKSHACLPSMISQSSEEETQFGQNYEKTNTGWWGIMIEKHSRYNQKFLQEKCSSTESLKDKKLLSQTKGKECIPGWKGRRSENMEKSAWNVLGEEGEGTSIPWTALNVGHSLSWDFPKGKHWAGWRKDFKVPVTLGTKMVWSINECPAAAYAALWMAAEMLCHEKE